MKTSTKLFLFSAICLSVFCLGVDWKTVKLFSSALLAVGALVSAIFGVIEYTDKN